MDGNYASPKDVSSTPNFQDMETLHKDKPKVTGQGGFGDESANIRKTMAHPNEADVAMQNMLDKNGRR